MPSLPAPLATWACENQRRAQLGRKSERIDDAQLALALEDLVVAAATLQAAAEAAGAVTKRTPKPRKIVSTEIRMPCARGSRLSSIRTAR